MSELPNRLLLDRLRLWKWDQRSPALADWMAATWRSTSGNNSAKPTLSGAPSGTSQRSAASIRRLVARTLARSHAIMTCAAKLPAYIFTTILAVVSSSSFKLRLLSRKTSSSDESGPAARRNLVKAAALLLAEIDRLDRAEARKAQP